MKHFNSIVLTFLLPILFIGCTSLKQTPPTNPEWYKNRSVQSQANYEIIGYGEGETIKEAESRAKENIAQTLISKIESSVDLTTSDYDGNFTTNTYSNLKVTSILNLQNVKTIKQEKMQDSFFVALQYENLDLAYRIKNSLGSFKCDDEKINSYLTQTPLIKKLTASLGCKLGFKLDRRDQAWYLKYNEHLFLLNDSEFEELFTTTKNSSFSFEPNKNVLVNGDSFYFLFNSKEDGYITLLDVYESGVVTLIQSSVAIKHRLQIPPKESENYFEAGLIKEGVNTHDLYVAIFSKEPLDMSRFEYANEDLASSELTYKFDELLQVMNGYRYSTVLLRTRSK